jgi:hypothetical protein
LMLRQANIVLNLLHKSRNNNFYNNGWVNTHIYDRKSSMVLTGWSKPNLCKPVGCGVETFPVLSSHSGGLSPSPKNTKNEDFSWKTSA